MMGMGLFDHAGVFGAFGLPMIESHNAPEKVAKISLSHKVIAHHNNIDLLKTPINP